MADLYIKWSLSNPNDTGARPINPCWPPNAVWNCASIWLTETQMPWPEVAQATVGKPVRINVAVYSNKATFTPAPGARVKVQVWVCDCTMGFGPQGGLGSAGGEAGRTASIFTAIMAPNTFGRAAVDWTPAQGDLRNFDAATGKGHLCIGANTYWEVAPPPAEGVVMPPPFTLDVCGNQHHGQKNISILPQKDEDAVLEIEVSSVGYEEPVEETYTIELTERLGAGVIGKHEKEFLLSYGFVTLVGGRPRKVRTRKATAEEAAELGERVGAALPIEPASRARLAGGGTLVLGEDRGVKLYTPRKPLEGAGVYLEDSDRGGRQLRVPVAPRKPKVLKLRLPADLRAKPGATRFFDVVQRRPGGRVVGGMTVGVVQLPV